jgi:hypothetical protein
MVPALPHRGPADSFGSTERTREQRRLQRYFWLLRRKATSSAICRIVSWLWYVVGITPFWYPGAIVAFGSRIDCRTKALVFPFSDVSRFGPTVAFVPAAAKV